MEKLPSKATLFVHDACASVEFPSDWNVVVSKRPACPFRLIPPPPALTGVASTATRITKSPTTGTFPNRVFFMTTPFLVSRKAAYITNLCPRWAGDRCAHLGEDWCGASMALDGQFLPVTYASNRVSLKFRYVQDLMDPGPTPFLTSGR